jgi:hypothetical protein
MNHSGSNRNKLPFKNPANPLKTQSVANPNRNTKQYIRSLAQRAPLDPQPLHRSRLTNRAVCVPNGVAGNAISNRHSGPLENAVTRTKQTIGTGSNRHFFAHVLHAVAPPNVKKRREVPHFVRDDRLKQEHSHEWLCHKFKGAHLKVAATNSKASIFASLPPCLFASSSPCLRDSVANLAVGGRLGR